VSCHLTPATTEDLADIEALRAEVVAWLATRGTDQWQARFCTRSPRRVNPAQRGLAAAIRRREAHLLREGTEVVAFLILDDYADPEFWTPDDKPDSGLYVHSMLVSRRHAGQDLGGVLLDWAGDQAARADKTWLRLDAWRTNTKLHVYYLRHGFTHIRTVTLPHRGSGALFQRPAMMTTVIPRARHQ
jgi:GNAT superfamily N-acetyltransferase